jgi:hypothetical protein
MPKFVKIPKTEDITKAVQRIKALRERDVVFDIPKDSILLSNSANLRLIRKTAEVLGKNLQFQIDDDLGKLLAIKAGAVLYGATPETIANLKPLRSVKTAIKSKTDTIPVGQKIPEQKIVQTARPKLTVSAQVPESKIQPPQAEKPMFSGFASTVSSSNAGTGIWNFIKRIFWSSASLATIAIVIILIFGISIGWIFLPQATVTVYARSEPISRDVEITVDAATNTTDQAKMVIPGEVVTKELSHTKNFPTTGTKAIGEKASGSIVMLNFTKNTLTLKASTTTLVAPNGKKYYFTQDVTGLRSTSKIGTPPEDEVDRSSLIAPIPIVAENPGDSYNLPVNQKFEVVNQALGKTGNVYAINEAAITGGTAQIIKILSQADLDGALKVMSDELAALVEQDFSSNEGKMKVLPSGSSSEILAQTANKEIGTETDEFDMTIIGRITALAYDEYQVSELISNQITLVMSEDKYLMRSSKESLTSQFRSIDLANKKGILAVHYETMAAYKFEAGNLKELLQGKTATEIKEILMARPEVDRVDVLFSPSFINKAPKYNGKIKINTVMSGV